MVGARSRSRAMQLELALEVGLRKEEKVIQHVFVWHDTA